MHKLNNHDIQSPYTHLKPHKPLTRERSAFKNPPKGARESTSDLIKPHMMAPHRPNTLTS